MGRWVQRGGGGVARCAPRVPGPRNHEARRNGASLHHHPGTHIGPPAQRPKQRRPTAAAVHGQPAPGAQAEGRAAVPGRCGGGHSGGAGAAAFVSLRAALPRRAQLHRSRSPPGAEPSASRPNIYRPRAAAGDTRLDSRRPEAAAEQVCAAEWPAGAPQGGCKGELGHRRAGERDMRRKL